MFKLRQGMQVVRFCKRAVSRTDTIIIILLLQLGLTADQITKEIQTIKANYLRIKKQLDYLSTQLENINLSSVFI